MIKSNFLTESKYLEEGYDFVIGIDEAGRGPLAGPVVACATTIRKSQISNPKSQTNSKYQISNSKLYDLIQDSKTLSHKQREKLYNFIHENFYVGVGICDHETIDRINILQATFLAMKQALMSLNSKIKNQNEKLKLKNQNLKNTKYKIANTKRIILVDGNKKIPNLSMDQKAIVNGDQIVKSISAASIVAKVTRDRIMIEMHKIYPAYGFNRHKGYATKKHFYNLKKHGPCEIHRKSFRPIKNQKKIE